MYPKDSSHKHKSSIYRAYEALQIEGLGGRLHKGTLSNITRNQCLEATEIETFQATVFQEFSENGLQNLIE